MDLVIDVNLKNLHGYQINVYVEVDVVSFSMAETHFISV